MVKDTDTFEFISLQIIVEYVVFELKKTDGSITTLRYEYPANTPFIPPKVDEEINVHLGMGSPEFRVRAISHQYYVSTYPSEKEPTVSRMAHRIDILAEQIRY